MLDKSSLLKSQGSLCLEIKDGLFHKMLLLLLMGFLTGWYNLGHAHHSSVHSPRIHAVLTDIEHGFTN